MFLLDVKFDCVAFKGQISPKYGDEIIGKEIRICLGMAIWNPRTCFYLCSKSKLGNSHRLIPVVLLENQQRAAAGQG